jgi:ABC-type phosphate transport system auxiliary subunit
MAAKKAALKVVKQENVLDTLAKAGVEVKLTKTEIADYIAEKAQEELQGQITDLKNQMEVLTKNANKTPTGKWKVLADALNDAKGAKDTYFLQYERRYNGCMVTLVLQTENGWHHGVVSVQVAESELPVELAQREALEKQLGELHKRLQTLQTKKHRILLIEKILSGTESGKVVLGDLTKLVNKLVNS